VKCVKLFPTDCQRLKQWISVEKTRRPHREKTMQHYFRSATAYFEDVWNWPDWNWKWNWPSRNDVDVCVRYLTCRVRYRSTMYGNDRLCSRLSYFINSPNLTSPISSRLRSSITVPLTSLTNVSCQIWGHLVGGCSWRGGFQPPNLKAVSIRKSTKFKNVYFFNQDMNSKFGKKLVLSNVIRKKERKKKERNRCKTDLT